MHIHTWAQLYIMHIMRPERVFFSLFNLSNHSTSCSSLKKCIFLFLDSFTNFTLLATIESPHLLSLPHISYCFILNFAHNAVNNAHGLMVSIVHLFLYDQQISFVKLSIHFEGMSFIQVSLSVASLSI